jgi:hypothetical protein
MRWFLIQVRWFLIQVRWFLIRVFSVQPPCALRLRGDKSGRKKTTTETQSTEKEFR